MDFLPVGINIENEQLLIIGGGRVALHKVEGLERFTRNIKVLAPEIIDEIRRREWIDIVEKHYEPADLQGHLLVYAATSDHGLNTRIRDDARNYRCLVNVVDMPANCDFISPAVFKYDTMSVAVSSNGENVYASIQWRNEIQKLVENGTITPVRPKHTYRDPGTARQETE